MRRPVFQTPHEVAVELFRRAHHVHLSSTLPDGTPVTKTVHGIVDAGALYFHAAPIGEKMETVGRVAVASAVEVVAQIPSYFTDPVRACPATTLYRSAQAQGEITEVTDAEVKANALRLLMEKFQPEGGFVPLDAKSALYRKAIAGIFVGKLSLDAAVGKAKLMQHKSPADRAKVMEALFRRGASGDLAAIEAIGEANPTDPAPAFLKGPGTSTLCLTPTQRDAEEAARLLTGTYWNDIFSEAELVRAHLASSAWVALHAEDGQLLASARAITDGVKHAWVYDVIVAPRARGAAYGTAVMRMLMEHPAVRGSRFVHLGTRDAQRFYARLGFVESSSIKRPYTATTMTLVRGTKESGEARLHTASPD